MSQSKSPNTRCVTFFACDCRSVFSSKNTQWLQSLLKKWSVECFIWHFSSLHFCLCKNTFIQAKTDCVMSSANNWKDNSQIWWQPLALSVHFSSSAWLSRLSLSSYPNTKMWVFYLEVCICFLDIYWVCCTYQFNIHDENKIRVSKSSPNAWGRERHSP